LICKFLEEVILAVLFPPVWQRVHTGGSWDHYRRNGCNRANMAERAQGWREEQGVSEVLHDDHSKALEIFEDGSGIVSNRCSKVFFLYLRCLAHK
jgi:hypothetical protein